MMKQAQVTKWGENPKLVTVPEVPLPTPSPDEEPVVKVRVLASGLHQVVRARANGSHYSAQGLPQIPGVDGVGITVPDGKLAYFLAMSVQGGSLSEFVTVPRKRVIPLPEGTDPVQVAGLANPVMASWMGLATRTDPDKLPKGFTAVVLGVTGVSGRAAVSVARIFGAGKVVGVGRGTGKLEGVELDHVVELGEVPTNTNWGAALEADVVLDFLWGPPTLALLSAIKPEKTVQFVQLGTVAGRDITIPGDLFRGKDIVMRGSGPGAWSFSQLGGQAFKMVNAIATGQIKSHKFKEVPIEDIEKEWDNTKDRIVFKL